ncbi:unnamed protein product, partial [Rotaria sp. Silwood1]
MSDDVEHQQVALPLMDESEKPTSDNTKQNLKTSEPRNNYCTEDYIVRYGVPVFIIILLIILLIL